MPGVSVLIKPVSGLCNLQCTYCFYRDEAESRSQESFGRMEETTLEAVIRKVLEYADEECTFAYQGGEPTLRGIGFYKKASELQKKYNTKNIPIHNAIQTNGYAIDDEWASFFAKEKFLVGVSLDGTKRTHDKCRKNYRNEGSFVKIMEGIRTLDRWNVDYNILTVVNRYTAGQGQRIYDFYKKKGFSYLQFIPCLDPVLETPGNHEYSLTPGAYGEFLKEIFDLWYEDLKMGQQPYIRQFENIAGMLMGLVPEACDQRGICGKQYVIEADGSVYPCDFYVLDGYCLGNLRTDDFPELDRKRKEIRFVEKSESFPPECRECRFFYLCRGGCRRHRMYEETRGGRNYFCEAYRAFFEYTMSRWRELAYKMQRR